MLFKFSFFSSLAPAWCDRVLYWVKEDPGLVEQVQCNAIGHGSEVVLL